MNTQAYQANIEADMVPLPIESFCSLRRTCLGLLVGEWHSRVMITKMNSGISILQHCKPSEGIDGLMILMLNLNPCWAQRALLAARQEHNEVTTK